MDAERRAPGVLALLALGLWLATPGLGHAYCRLTTADPIPGLDCPEGGVPLRWQAPCISYSVVQRDVASPPFADVRDAVDRSFATWTQVQCDGRPVGLSIRQTAELSRCDQAEHTPGAANVNSIIFAEDWAERGLSAEAFGVTLVWHDGETGEIVGADMQVNETMGELVECDGTCARGQVDLGNVITHEAGHFLGLGHSQSLTASMYGESRLGEIRKRFLNDDDRRGLCAVYGTRPRAACDAADHLPAGGLSPDCFVPGRSCGLSVAGGRAPPPRAALAALGLSPLLLLGRLTRRRRARRDRG